MTNVMNARNKYQRDSVLSAAPSQLLTMLYDRLLLDLQWAEAAQLDEDWARAGGRLMHAQDIVAELASSLKPELWDGGASLLSIYLYVLPVLRLANTERDIERTRECILLLEPLREAWHDAAAGSATVTSFDGLSAVG
jgi:flagellar protein FliS